MAAKRSLARILTIATSGFVLLAACQAVPVATPTPAASSNRPAATTAAAPAAATPASASPTVATAATAATSPTAGTSPAVPKTTVGTGPTATPAVGITPATPGTQPAAGSTPAVPATQPAANTSTAAAATTPAARAPSTGAAIGTPAAAGSAGSGQAPERVVTIDALDYSFAVADTIEGGPVTIRFTNKGKETHHAQFARIKDGQSLDQFLAALQKGQEGALPLVSLEGGPAAIAPNGTEEVRLDLKAGQYVLLCFIPSPDGVPHLAKGMVKPLRVTEPSAGAATAPAPPTAGTITMRDFTYDLPASITAGTSTFRVINEGPQPHEAVFVKLAEGKSVQDFVAFFAGRPSGPPPGTDLGGMQGLDKENAGFATVNLTPGEYALVCQIPDPATGKPHLALGMAKSVTVK